MDWSERSRLPSWTTRTDSGHRSIPSRIGLDSRRSAGPRAMLRTRVPSTVEQFPPAAQPHNLHSRNLCCVPGRLLLSFVSRTITHPLDNLVSGVRALAAGDYMFSITPRGSSEVAELGEAFSKMRSELLV